MKGLLVLLLLVLAITACAETSVEESSQPDFEEPNAPTDSGTDVFSEDTDVEFPPLPE